MARSSHTATRFTAPNVGFPEMHQRRSTMRLIRLFTVPAAAGAIVLLGMSSALAGEAQGNSSAGNINETGMRGHANSICAFSGQNPERFLDPSDPNYEPGRVQTWGQV